MANEGQRGTAGIEGLAGAAEAASGAGPPPVHLWRPPYCGDIDMRIAADGTWFYQKTPIGRPAMVKLFASILKREGDRYFLVTPVEKCGITVDDAPFLAVEIADRAGPKRPAPAFPHQCGRLGRLRGRSSVALRAPPKPADGGLKPYLHVRRGLWAKVTRALFFDLVDLGEERAHCRHRDVRRRVRRRVLCDGAG